MNPDQWERVSDLFAIAAELAPAEREAFLARVGRESPEVLAELESLLAAHEGTDALPGKTKLGRIAAAVDAAAAPAIVSAGPYRILRELGHGGMGAVYLAERADGQFDQRVALKLIKRGLPSEHLLQRFLVERQILARLQHPNIARLLDGGVTADGQPFFAMDYIEGEPLVSYCDDRRLGLDARLHLFRQVCEAVQYAHRNLIVHRDLKPSNILVTADGEPKLLDFGIAKVLDESGGASGDLTREGLHPVTPDFGAPEQFTGDPITTATDVYALGVVLYELLCGHRPHRAQQRSPAEVIELVCRTTPARPSARAFEVEELENGAAGRIVPEEVAAARDTTPSRLQRHLSGDLDTIVLTAIRKEPERRYASAEALSEDVGLYLAGRPIKAHPDSLGYRARKFVQRHAVSVAGTAVVLLAIVGGLMLALWQRNIAAREAAKAAAVSAFLQNMLSSVDPDKAQGAEVTVRQVLDEAAQRLDAGETALSGQQAVEASVRSTIGLTYRALGEYEKAATQLSRAWELQKAALGSEHPDTLSTMSTLGTVYVAMGRYEDAEPLYVGSREAMRRVLGDEHEDTLRATNRLAALYGDLGDFAKAEELARFSFEVRRRTLGPENSSTLASQFNLAITLLQQNRMDEGIALLEQTLAAQRRTLGNGHRHTLFSINGLASAYKDTGRYDEAIALDKEAIEIRREVLGPEHPDTVISVGQLANSYNLAGRVDEANALYGEAIPLQIRILGAEHPKTLETTAYQADMLLGQGDFAEAEPMLLGVLDARRRVLGDDHPQTHESIERLAELYTRWDQPARAEQYRSMLPPAEKQAPSE